MNTKDNPACYHSALIYLSNITGIGIKKDIIVNKPEYLRTTPHKNRNDKTKFKTKLKYKADSIAIHTKCGNSVSYFPQPNKRYDECGYEFEYATVSVNRDIKEFGVEVQSCGTYNECLGGGWTTKTPLFRVGDFYFAYLECSC